MYDLVLQNGQVITAGDHPGGFVDIALSDGKIVKVEAGIGDAAAHRTLDLAGHLIVPGLFDIHSHIYDGVTPIGIDVAEVTFPGGVTASVDAGSCGGDTFDGFRRWIAEPSAARVFCFINLSRIGLTGLKASGELVNERYADPETTVRLLQEFPNIAVGTKIRVSRSMTGGPCAPMLKLAREVATTTGTPLMVHIGDSVEPLEEILEIVGPGDIITHCQTAKSAGLVDDSGNVRRAVIEARERGILFDSGHGLTHFDFEVGRVLLEQGLVPDSLSTDISRTTYENLAPGLLTVLNKWLALGLDLVDGIAACTARPIAALFPDATFGQIAPGFDADLAILNREEGDFVYTDSAGRSLSNDWRLTPHMTIRAGQIVWSESSATDR